MARLFKSVFTRRVSRKKASWVPPNPKSKVVDPNKYIPSNINYNQIAAPNYVANHSIKYSKPKIEQEYKLEPVSHDISTKEQLRAINMNKILEEAKSAGSELTLQLGCIICRSPVILPDLKRPEIIKAELEERAKQYLNKSYPTKNLNMNIPKNVEHTVGMLPLGVEKWVFKALSRDTKRLGPYLKFPNLEERLQTGKDVSGDKSLDKGTSGNKKQVDIEDGWFDESSEKASTNSSSTDVFAIEVNLPSYSGIDKKDFEPRSRFTKDDEKNNFKSVDRKLSENLYLIVKVKTENGEFWRFPEFVYNNCLKELNLSEEEKLDLREVVERALQKATANSCDFFFTGNAPSFFINERNSSFGRTPKVSYGRSTFFYRAHLTEDMYGPDAFNFTSIVGKSISDYAWITKDDLKLFSPNSIEKEYWESCASLLE